MVSSGPSAQRLHDEREIGQIVAPHLDQAQAALGVLVQERLHRRRFAGAAVAVEQRAIGHIPGQELLGVLDHQLALAIVADKLLQANRVRRRHPHEPPVSVLAHPAERPVAAERARPRTSPGAPAISSANGAHSGGGQQPLLQVASGRRLHACTTVGVHPERRKGVPGNPALARFWIDGVPHRPSQPASIEPAEGTECIQIAAHLREQRWPEAGCPGYAGPSGLNGVSVSSSRSSR